MKQDRHEEGRFSENARGLGTATEAMVRQRAKELAVINGRSEQQVLDSDLEQARRELTGDEKLNPKRDPAEQIPETDRWQAVADNSGAKTANVPAPDEQTFAEKLVQEGMQDAEHDQMVKATKKSLRDDTKI